MAKVTKAAVVKALAATHGNVSGAARLLGVSRRAISKRIDGDPELKQALVDARETLLDDAEHSLAEAVRGGAGWAVCFTLKTLGRGRGYVQGGENKLEVSGPDGGPITIVPQMDLAAKMEEIMPIIQKTVSARRLELQNGT